MSPTGCYERPTLEARFDAKVARRGADECWPWTGSRSRRGYGQIYASGRLHGAHRIAVELATGERVHPDAVVMHSCDNPPCCNPAHLSVGTRLENVRDAIAKGRAFPVPRYTGEAHARAKLTAAQVSEIRARCIRGSSTHGIAAFARKFGVSKTAVYFVICGRKWKAVAS